jgi:hypothetical protein
MSEAVSVKEAMPPTCVFERFKRFRQEYDHLEDDPSSRQLSTVRKPQTVAKVRELIEKDRQMTLQLMEDQLPLRPCHGSGA